MDSKQYSLTQILGIWLAAALPMAFLAWIAAPALISYLTLPAALVFWLLIILGIIWQLLLSLWIVYCEESNLYWSTIRRRVWLNTPRDPRTGNPRPSLLWWLLPCLFVAVLSLTFGVLFTSLSPFIHNYLPVLERIPRWPAFMNVTDLTSPEFSDQWWLLGLALFSGLLSAFLAEEFLFRGILLPRMNGVFGKRDWLANATLFALYCLHKPWMIPFRFFAASIMVWAARRFRSNWIPVIVRGAEGVGLVALVLIGVAWSSIEPLSATITLPRISRQPDRLIWYRNQALTSLPGYNPNFSASFQADLRGYDLSNMDLRQALENLLQADFDNQTHWPPKERMPEGFDPNSIMNLGKNPGLGISNLHAQGITGRGIGIAIIDQHLLANHQEYAEQLQWYEEVNLFGMESASMHGPAVASIAVGRTVGVAPGAALYFIGVGSHPKALFMYHHYFAQGIRRILQLNNRLPEDRKIRVISISLGWSPEVAGYQDIVEAVKLAEARGLLVVYPGMEYYSSYGFDGLGRYPTADPDSFESYRPGQFWAQVYYAGSGNRTTNTLLVPMDSRTTASPTGENEYVFYHTGGESWATPYVAGVYALTAQVDPSITPARFWSLAIETGRYINVQHDGREYALGPIVDPERLIESLR